MLVGTGASRCLHLSLSGHSCFNPSPPLPNDVVSKSLALNWTLHVFVYAGLLCKNMISVLALAPPSHQIWLHCEVNKNEASVSFIYADSFQHPRRAPGNVLMFLNKIYRRHIF